MEFEYKNNTLIMYQAKKQVGKILLEEFKANIYKVISVFVEEGMRGQGVARKLMEKLVEKARVENILLLPDCSYAVSFFKKHEDNNDVLFIS